MALIQSNSCLFQVDTDGTYRTVMCLRNFRVSPETETKEITAPSDGHFKDYDYKQISYSVSLDGVMYAEDPANPVLFDFATYQLGFLQIKFRAIYIDTAGKPKVFRGEALVERANIEASPGAILSGTVDLLGKGRYYMEDSLPEYINLRIRMRGNNSTQAFLKIQLINSDGEAVFQTDTLAQASGGNLANPLDITVPALKGNWYYWFQIVSDSVGNQFDLDAPPTKTTNFQNGNFSETSFPSQLYDFTADRTIDIQFGVSNPPPTCVPPGIPGSPNLPNGTEGVPWSYSFPLSGNSPFNIANVTKPAWMNITTVNISGTDYVQLSGTPSGTGLGQVVEFDIQNACGSVQFSDLIGVVSNPFSATINWSFTEPGGAAYGFRIYRNGILIVGTDTANSGSITVTNADSIEAMIVGNVFTLKHLKVDSSTSGNLYDSTSAAPTKTFTWNAVTGSTYTVLAEGLT